MRTFDLRVSHSTRDDVDLVLPIGDCFRALDFGFFRGFGCFGNRVECRSKAHQGDECVLAFIGGQDKTFYQVTEGGFGFRRGDLHLVKRAAQLLAKVCKLLGFAEERLIVSGCAGGDLVEATGQVAQRQAGGNDLRIGVTHR